jgi:hypothetical protein
MCCSRSKNRCRPGLRSSGISAAARRRSPRPIPLRVILAFRALPLVPLISALGATLHWRVLLMIVRDLVAARALDEVGG